MNDTTPPVITVPADKTVPATGTSGAVVTYTVAAVDDVDGSIAVACTPASGATFPVGPTTVTCTAHDAAANMAAKSFKVTVVADTTAPVITTPADMTVAPKSAAGTVVNFTASATDDIDGSVPVTCAPSSGSTFPVGATTVICQATDKAANPASKSFKVTVTSPTAPAITVPPDRTVGAESAAGDVVTFTVTATDAIDGTAPVTCSPASGSTFPIGMTTVTCTAANSAGKSSTKSFVVTVDPPQSYQTIGTATVASVRIKANLATVNLACTGSDTSNCTVKAQLLSATATAAAAKARTAFATRTVTLASGETKTVRLRLNKAGNARLRKLHRLSVLLRLTQTDDSGRTRTKTQTLVFTH